MTLWTFENTVINDLNCCIDIQHILGLQYKFIMICNEIEYTCIFYEEGGRLNRLLAALGNEHGMFVQCQVFINVAEISLHHPLFTLHDRFFLYTFHKS